MQELEVLFANGAKPVSELFPYLLGPETDLMVRALFSSEPCPFLKQESPDQGPGSLLLWRGLSEPGVKREAVA